MESDGEESDLELAGDESVFEAGGDFDFCFAAPVPEVDEALLDVSAFL